MKNSTGEYAGWKGADETRDRFIDDLTDTMHKGINKVVIRSLVLPDYQDFDTRYRLTETIGGPYPLTQAATLLMVLQWLTEKKEPTRDTFEAVIELGDSGQKAFKKFLRKNAAIEPKYRPKTDPASGEPFTPLNACDLIAGQHRRLYLASLKVRKLTPKALWPASLLKIRRRVPIHATMIERKFLKHFCETLMIAPRSITT